MAGHGFFFAGNNVVDCGSCVLVDELLVALFVFDNLADEQFHCNGAGTVSNCSGQIRLQTFGERVVTFAGNNSEDVNVMHVISKYIGIHSLAGLVDAEAQAAPHLLPLADIAAALLQGANLEYIRVVPALPQGGVGEDEPHRGANWVAVQQQLLVPHNQLIGTHIIRGRFLTANLGVDHFAFAVHRKITSVGLCRRDSLQIPEILVITNGKLHGVYDILVFLLKYGGVFAVDRLACGIIFPVVCHFVNEEQGKHLNALVKQLALPLDVGEDGFSYLDTPHLVLVHDSNDIPGKNLDTVDELHRVISSIDLLDHKAVSIFFQTTGVVIKVISNFTMRLFFFGTPLAIFTSNCKVAVGSLLDRLMLSR